MSYARAVATPGPWSYRSNSQGVLRIRKRTRRNSGVFKTLGSKLLATRCSRLIEVRVLLSVTKNTTQAIDDFIAT